MNRLYGFENAVDVTDMIPRYKAAGATAVVFGNKAFPEGEQPPERRTSSLSVYPVAPGQVRPAILWKIRAVCDPTMLLSR